MVCIGCGFDLAQVFTFCPHCGRRRLAASGEADRRQVTVLFADVSGFTALAERLDPEEVRAFQSALFETLAQAIEHFDGFVEKFVGDAVLAVFGAPVAHEDDPERALSAALDILGRSARVSEEWATRLDGPVNLHIAVHTGPVVAGSLGSVAGGAYAVTGDTVNTAARLLAAPGTILVSKTTYALTRHRFAFGPARRVTLRGRSEPIVAHDLLGVLPQPGSARGLARHGLGAAMVGRADELNRLVAAFDRMRHGQAQFVNLIGEAGTGKSRLIAEFLRRLEVDDRLGPTAVRRIACSSLGEPTYGIFAAMLREAYQVGLDDSLDAARQKLVAGLLALGAAAEEAEATAPMLGYALGVEQTRPHDFEPEQLKRQIALAARGLLERRLQQAPMLIVVEDLHWADTASLDLLRDIVDHLADRPLMTLLSCRPDARRPLVARATQSTIRLEPLSADETRLLVRSLFGTTDEDAFPQVQELVAARAEGNPLFVEEIIRSLVDEGALTHDGNGWTCVAACNAVDVPPTLHGLLLSRVDRLPANVRRLLQEAAVQGMAFDKALLLAVATDPATAPAALDRLVAADLIQPIAGQREIDRYRFSHALVHEVVYGNLLLARRGELHERIGCVLECAAGSEPERLSDLAALGHHWSLAPDKRKGARYLVAAGDWARAVYANDDAMRHYQRALRTLADCHNCDGEVRAVRERLADLLALTGRRDQALAHYDAVRHELEAGEDQAIAARLHRKIGVLHWEAGDRERASACFAAGLERLGTNGNAIERAQLFEEIGRLAFRTGDNAGAIAWAERALAEAADEKEAADGYERGREAAATRAQAYNTLGVALARTGRLSEAVDRIEQSIGLAEGHDLPQAACRGYANLGVLYSSLNPRRSIETSLRGLETAKKTGDLGFQSRLHANLAVAYCALTDRCEAEGISAAQTAVELDRRLGLLDHLAVPLIVLGQIHQCRGDQDQAFTSYAEALALAERAGEPQLLFPCYDGLATLYLDAGDQVLAEAYLVKSQQLCERAGLEPGALMVLPFLC